MSTHMLCCGGREFEPESMGQILHVELLEQLLEAGHVKAALVTLQQQIEDAVGVQAEAPCEGE